MQKSNFEFKSPSLGAIDKWSNKLKSGTTLIEDYKEIACNTWK